MGDVGGAAHRAGRRRATRYASIGLLLGLATGCSILPDELNLSPIYRHRIAEDGTLLELDALWPIFHYEQRTDGGSDFRIRPFYRRIQQREPDELEYGAATEHQFLVPLGRVRYDEKESSSRLFPLFWAQSRLNQDHQRELDWYFLFPFFWGGSSEARDEDYFAFFPLYADIPGFLTYDRLQIYLFPLYVGTEKDGRQGNVFLWPFIGYGYGDNGMLWHRILPFYSYWVDPRFRRFSFLFPFFHWGTEQLDTDDPLSRFFFFPLFGFQSSEKVSAWTFLWPFFQGITRLGASYRLDILWPLFRYFEEDSDSLKFKQWWLFPIVARTLGEYQQAWNFLWPLVWLRTFQDPSSEETQEWIIPFYWQVERRFDDGRIDRFKKIWPFYHYNQEPDGSGEWRVPTLLPLRRSSLTGVYEAWGWLWTLARGRTRTEDDKSFELWANLFTKRTRGERTQSSVPFLYNYESDGEDSVLRLLQFFPIRWSSSTEGDESNP